MSSPHIILVHGRSTKPSATEKRRLVKQALFHGLQRASESAHNALDQGKVSFSLAYFGDINNRVLKEGQSRWLTSKDPVHAWGPCEPDGYYDESMAASFQRPSDGFTAQDYARLLREEKDLRLVDEIASIASRIASPLGLNGFLVRHSSPDLGAYFADPEIGESIRDRVRGPLMDALPPRRRICLIAHSMGCLVAYDTLWQISRDSEYQEMHRQTGCQVELFLTLGNPLGEPGVRANLLDAKQSPSEHFPRGILHNWINLSAEDDYIAHDKTVADDYRDMLEHGYLHRIIDRPAIYNFWVHKGRSNPHKLYGYLDHPVVGAEIARWILGRKAVDPGAPILGR
ncbi:MAG: hypothetical protein P1V35_13430 [Planctomycetota bacterium]|nr:hypothetical protein [Planctomycetota bacterium]